MGLAAKYAKPALSFKDQLAKIKGRGMIVVDDASTIHAFKTIGYYRLSAYFHPFTKTGDTYECNTSFETIQMLYSFDRKLRLLLLDAIERIEVALRTAVTHHIGMKFGSFGHCDRRAFVADFRHAEFLNEIRLAESESHEAFVQHFRAKYSADSYLPIWMAAELLSFGSVSRTFKSLTSDLFKQVIKGFNAHEFFLPSWIHSLSYVRNLCAHHSRLWNRSLAIRPKLPNPTPWFPYRIDNNANIYCILVIAHHLLETVAPQEKWTGRVVELLNEFPNVPTASLGMPVDWRSRSPWFALTAASHPDPRHSAPMT